jgi:hypothetical protein
VRRLSRGRFRCAGAPCRWPGGQGLTKKPDLYAAAICTKVRPVDAMSQRSIGKTRHRFRFSEARMIRLRGSPNAGVCRLKAYFFLAVFFLAVFFLTTFFAVFFAFFAFLAMLLSIYPNGGSIDMRKSGIDRRDIQTTPQLQK